MKTSITHLSIFIVRVLVAEISFGDEQKSRPNILYIMSDDHTTQAFGVYGSRLASLNPTPHIDQLAREGMRFNEVFCNNSICTPSRASIITGQYLYGVDFEDPPRLSYWGSQADIVTPPGWELYDMENDPHEMSNLYEKPDYAEIIAELKNKLKSLREELDETDEDYPHIQKVIDEHWDD